MKNQAERIQKIKQLLTTAFSPSVLEIKDDSHKHAGHFANHQGAGHFSVQIASPAFSGKNRVEAHKMIYQALNELIPTEIHALQIKLIDTDSSKP